MINLHADVAESVVLGLEDKDWGEIVGIGRLQIKQ